MVVVSTYCIPLAILSGFAKLTFSDYEVQNDLIEGEKRYHELSQRGLKYGDCWKSAIRELHLGCRHLTDVVQSRLALDFANCFLKNSGSRTCVCPREKKVSDCLANTDERIFSTYREFYTHTRSICYYLQHQIWQENTENTIKELSSNSEKISEQLENSTKFQEAILHLQQIALVKQQKLIKKSETNLQNLNFELEKSRSNAKAVLEEFKLVSDEQNLWISAVYSHVKKLENLVIGQLTGFHTYVYYSAAMILSYILTSARQTSEARIWLYFLVSLNAILERVIAEYSIDEEAEEQFLLNEEGPINYRIWICRKAFCIISCLVLIVKSYRYQDYNVINNRLLLSIQRQYEEIQSFIHEKSRDSDANESRIKSDTKEEKLPVIHYKKTTEDEIITETSNTEQVAWPFAILEKLTRMPIFNQMKIKAQNMEINSPEVVKKQENTLTSVTETNAVPTEKKNTKRKSGGSRVKNQHYVNDGNFDQSCNETFPVISPKERYNLRTRTKSSTPASDSKYLVSPRSLSAVVRKAVMKTKETEVAVKKLIVQQG